MGPSATEFHEITVTRAQARAISKVLGLPVEVGDRIRVEVVRESVSAWLPMQRQAPDSANDSTAWEDWLQGLDTDEPVHLEVPAAVVLTQAREHGEV